MAVFVTGGFVPTQTAPGGGYSICMVVTFCVAIARISPTKVVKPVMI
jgi:hypothetical protein